MENRIKLFLALFIIGFTFSNISAKQGDFHEELYEISPLGNNIFENIVNPYIDDNAVSDFEVEDFNFEQETPDRIVLRADIAPGDPCPWCVPGTIQADGTCDNCNYSVTANGDSLITGTPVGDGFFTLLFAGLLYFCLAVYREVQKQKKARVST